MHLHEKQVLYDRMRNLLKYGIDPMNGIAYIPVGRVYRLTERRWRYGQR